MKLLKIMLIMTTLLALTSCTTDIGRDVVQSKKAVSKKYKDGKEKCWYELKGTPF